MNDHDLSHPGYQDPFSIHETTYGAPHTTTRIIDRFQLDSMTSDGRIAGKILESHPDQRTDTEREADSQAAYARYRLGPNGRTHCTATKKNGDMCNGFAIRDSDKCYFHRITRQS
jgi:hypothetical protein